MLFVGGLPCKMEYNGLSGAYVTDPRQKKDEHLGFLNWGKGTEHPRTRLLVVR